MNVASSLIELQRKARMVRSHVLKMTAAAKAPHVGSALSCVDMLVAIYFHAAKTGAEIQHDPDRDRVILSKGHASAALYSCLAERGYFDPQLLMTYCADGSQLAEHPSYGVLPGVEATTGSLGHGLGLGLGLAMGAKMRSSPSRVFVVLSDGECNEGSIWEAALWAPRHGLDNLTAIVDFNKFQATGPSTKITQLEPFVDKWRAFGWDALEIDGHDMGQLIDALGKPKTGQPRAIVAHTIKGKGVSFMEGDLEWHYRPPNPADLARALQEVAGI